MTLPAPSGLGISPPNQHGTVLYNVPVDQALPLLDDLSTCPLVVSDWHDRADRGTPWAEALRLPERAS